jgi:hypothetical protein
MPLVPLIYPRARGHSRCDPPLRTADSTANRHRLVLASDDVRAGERMPVIEQDPSALSAPLNRDAPRLLRMKVRAHACKDTTQHMRISLKPQCLDCRVLSNMPN